MHKKIIAIGLTTVMAFSIYGCKEKEPIETKPIETQDIFNIETEEEIETEAVYIPEENTTAPETNTTEETEAVETATEPEIKELTASELLEKIEIAAPIENSKADINMDMVVSMTTDGVLGTIFGGSPKEQVNSKANMSGTIEQFNNNGYVKLKTKTEIYDENNKKTKEEELDGYFVDNVIYGKKTSSENQEPAKFKKSTTKENAESINMMLNIFKSGLVFNESATVKFDDNLKMYMVTENIAESLTIFQNAYKDNEELVMALQKKMNSKLMPGQESSEITEKMIQSNIEMMQALFGNEKMTFYYDEEYHLRKIECKDSQLHLQDAINVLMNIQKDSEENQFVIALMRSFLDSVKIKASYEINVTEVNNDQASDIKLPFDPATIEEAKSLDEIINKE